MYDKKKGGVRSRLSLLAAAALLPVLATPPALAAPGTLPNSPLFLGINVEPNLMFVIDDSGSMDWEVLTLDANRDGRFTGTQPDGTSPAGSGSVTHRDSDEDNDADCDFGTNGQDFYGYVYIIEVAENNYSDDGLDCNTADEEAWRMRNSDFNLLYFDPSKDYPPWQGTDINGNTFTDMPINAALANPYRPDISSVINLEVDNSNWRGAGTPRGTSDRDDDNIPDGFRYYTWEDSDGDGLFDDDCNGTRAGGPGGANCDTVTEYLIKDQSADIKQKFANWFSYYRSREHVAKAAYGQVISATQNIRMGLMTLHNNNNVNTPAASMNGDVTSGAKKALLDSLYSFTSSGGTPLRTALNACGSYLACDSANSPFGDACPALSAADGGACQQNFIIAMTDGYYNGASPGVGNADGDNSSPFDSGTNGPFGDLFGDTLADVAMKYYETDLQPGLDDNVPTIAGVDEANFQHAVTYTVGFGVNGTLSSMPAVDAALFAWPDPGSTDRLNRIDDLRHAAYNGRGQFLSAYQADVLAAALAALINDIIERTGSAASVTFNSGSLSADSRVFLALFNSNRWSGSLTSYSLDSNTGRVSASPDWQAGDLLDGLSWNNRNLFTYSRENGQGKRFRWGQLTDAQKLDMCTGPISSGTPCDVDDNGTPGDPSDDTLNGNNNGTIGQDRLQYLRGNRSKEGGSYNFRVRGSVLGDIVHSGPLFVGTPNVWGTVLDDHVPTPYGDFVTEYGNRKKVVYVGANDGMLHAFDADSGSELMGYLPGALFSNEANEGLHYLTDPGYVHRYYVDLEPVISDAFVTSSTGGSARWRTVLIGGLRGGGQGYFALDVTDPDGSFDETNSNATNLVMWEFTSEDDPDLGYTYSLPTIAMLANGKWAAIFGNGYEDPADGATGDGEAKLFVVYLEGGLDGVWTEGTDYFKISTKRGDAADRNALASPAVIDSDGDGLADRAYAGDLQGNMWAFDLSGDASSWGSVYGSSSSPKPLFSTAAGQPITTRPLLVANPLFGDDVMVYFGTGRYLVESDPGNTDTQSFYGVIDRDGELGVSDLLQQSFSQSGDLRTVTANRIDPTTHSGWRINFPAGERVVVNADIRRGTVLFNTLVPNSAICEYGGSGWLTALNYIDGGAPDRVPFDANGDGVVDEYDLLGDLIPAGKKYNIGIPAESAILDGRIYTPGTSTTTGSTDDDANGIDVKELESGQTGVTGRLSWEEI